MAEDPNNTPRTHPQHPQHAGHDASDGPEVRRESLDALVDRILDGEFDRTDELRTALERVSSDPDAEHDLREYAGAIGPLAEMPAPPEGLADRVLDEVAVRRGFLSATQRRVVTRGRVAAAALLIVSFGGLMLAYRASPAMFDLRERPAPIAGFDRAVRSEALPGAMASAERLAGEFERTFERTTAPIIAAFRDGTAPAHPASLAPGSPAPDAIAAAGPRGLGDVPTITWHRGPDAEAGDPDPYAQRPVAGAGGMLWVTGLFDGVDTDAASGDRAADRTPAADLQTTARPVVFVHESTDAIFGTMRYEDSGVDAEMVIRIRVPAARSAEWVRQRLGIDRYGRVSAPTTPGSASVGSTGDSDSDSDSESIGAVPDEQPSPPATGGTGVPRR